MEMHAVSRASEIEEVDDLLRQFNDSSDPSDEQIGEPGELLRKLHASWVDNGGHVSGKRRNSLRQLSEMLAANETKVLSLQPKLAGHTRITRQDAYALIDLFLRHWRYVGDPSQARASTQDYASFPEIEIDKVVDKITDRLFRGNYKSSGRNILLPIRERRSDHRQNFSFDKHMDNYRKSDAVIKIPFFKRELSSNSILGMRNFIENIKYIYRSSLQSGNDVSLIWILDIGSRQFNDDSAFSAFSNVEFLATQLRSMRIFADDSYDQEGLWNWLQKSSVFLIGGLKHGEIDSWYDNIGFDLERAEISWPWLSAERIFLGSIPDTWVMADQFRELYGRNLENLDKRSFTLFYRANGWSDDAESDLRYFAYGPAQSGRNKSRSIAMDDISIELPPPGITHDGAFRVVCTAAFLRLGKEHVLADNIDPQEALAHLRYLSFAVLVLDEFLNFSPSLLKAKYQFS